MAAERGTRHSSPGVRAVIYARYSSDQQRAASIDDQIRLCRERIAQEGWTLGEIFSDAAISGASGRRPGYQAMLQGGRNAAFDVIVAEALDRLSRDQEDVAGLFKRLRFAGVRLVTLTEGEISELHVGLSGTMNALFLRDLANKTRRGLRGRVEAGRSGGGNAFGYAVVRELGPDGEVVHGARRIVEAEAAVVRRIMENYAAGLSPKTIALALNGEKVAGPRGGSWSPSTINGNRGRGTGILNNELYVGRLVWNRLSYVKDPETGRRRSRANDAKNLAVAEVPHLRIVSDALWARVRERQARLDEKAKASGGAPRAKRRPRHIFSGLMRCGVCGSGFSKISAAHFGCSGARNKGETVCTNRATIRCDALEAVVLDGLRTRLMDPATYKAFADAFVVEWNRQVAEDAAKGAGHRDELDRVSRQIERIVDAIADGDTLLAVVRDRLIALEERKKELTRLVADPVASPPRLHPNLAEVYRQEVASLTDALANEGGAEAREIVRGLVEQVTVHPACRGDGLRVEVHGALSAMLALGGGGGAVPALLAEQMKLVAGAGFEPAAFRL